jgi:hypothetical protein
VYRIEAYINKAQKFIDINEPDAALNNLRKGIEAISNEIIKIEKFVIQAKRPELNDKILEISRQIKNKAFSMPKHLTYAMQHIQTIGNHASHDQEDEIPISKASAEAALIQMREIKDWYFSHYDLHLQKAIKTKKASVRKKTSPESLIKELAKVDSDSSVELAEVFESIEKLGLWLQTGTSKIGSIRVRSPKRIEFLDSENKLLFERRFNFGVFYGDGKFKNFSCEGKLGKEYLQELSNLIPDSKVFEHSSTEFRNCVVKTSGEGLLIKDILQVKNSWLKLLEKYLRKMNS